MYKCEHFSYDLFGPIINGLMSDIHGVSRKYSVTMVA